MAEIDRRKFLKLVGVGSAAVVGSAMMTSSGFLSWSGRGSDALSFRAVVGLPTRPLPSYASYVIDGNLDLVRGTGVMSMALYAGDPGNLSSIVFPGTARSVTVTNVAQAGSSVTVSGKVVDGSRLLPGESASVNVQIDRSQGIAYASFLGTQYLFKVTS